jgi:hypothetical protein
MTKIDITTEAIQNVLATVASRDQAAQMSALLLDMQAKQNALTDTVALLPATSKLEEETKNISSAVSSIGTTALKLDNMTTFKDEITKAIDDKLKGICESRSDCIHEVHHEIRQ